jgi:hypothetical protein
MIRSKQFELATESKLFMRKGSKGQFIGSDFTPQPFKERDWKSIEDIDQIESGSNKKNGRTAKYFRSDEQTFTSCQMKSSIQGIITPVVQISYNQIKSAKDEGGFSEKATSALRNPTFSQRSHRIDIMQTVNSLNRALSRKAKNGKRVASLNRSLNKGSFVSEKIHEGGKSPKILLMNSQDPSTSFQQNLNTIDDEELIDEHIPGESILKNRANSIHVTMTYNKRSMSEMQKSIGSTISITRATPITSNWVKDKSKNQIFKTLNGIKTVSLNDLTGSTNSGDQSSGRYAIRPPTKGVFTSHSGTQLLQKPWKMHLNSVQKNNNSISQLKINDKNLLIDLENHSKEEPYYSPLARERSNTTNSSRELMFNK